MPVTRGKSRVKHARISMSADEYEALKEIARERNTTVSDLLVQAAAQVASKHANLKKMLSIVGMGEGSDSEGSAKHDHSSIATCNH